MVGGSGGCDCKWWSVVVVVVAGCGWWWPAVCWRRVLACNVGRSLRVVELVVVVVVGGGGRWWVGVIGGW